MGNEEHNKAIVTADIVWIKEALREMKTSLKEMTVSYVTKGDFAELKKTIEDKHTNFEDRIRTLETFKTEIGTKIQQWGLFGGLLFTIINIIISKYL